MPEAVKTYVRIVDSLSWYMGLFAMYLVFADDRRSSPMPRS